MNKEVRRISNYINDTKKYPDRLSDVEMLEISKALMQQMSKYYEAEGDNTLEEQRDAMIRNVYIILKTLAKMGISPDYIMHTIIQNKLGNVLTSSSGDDVKDSAIVLFDKIRREVEEMKEPNYYGGLSNIEGDYHNFKKIFDTLEMDYSDEETTLSKNAANNYYFRKVNEIYAYSDGNDLIDDVYYLVSMLYTDMCTFVRMGINPITYLNDFLDEKENKRCK